MIRIEADMIWDILTPRDPESHKGTYGRVLCLAGSRAYRGAAALCTEGALRSGAGIVQLASLETVLSGVWPLLPECLPLTCTEDKRGCIASENADILLKALEGSTAFAAGPGMNKSPSLAPLLAQLVRAADCPVVLDADGLNNLAELPALPHPKGENALIITPHPGEMARLCGKTVAEVKESGDVIALEFAAQNNCIVVLKGHRTLIATPDGHLYQNTTGNAGLARGGSGDILTGMIGGLLAQGISPLQAAIAGVWLHGAAADRCSARKSQIAMLPKDIFEDLGVLLAEQGL